MSFESHSLYKASSSWQSAPTDALKDPQRDSVLRRGGCDQQPCPERYQQVPLSPLSREAPSTLTKW
jgi:hypothetical protein